MFVILQLESNTFKAISMELHFCFEAHFFSRITKLLVGGKLNKKILPSLLFCPLNLPCVMVWPVYLGITWPSFLVLTYFFTEYQILTMCFCSDLFCWMCPLPNFGQLPNQIFFPNFQNAGSCGNPDAKRLYDDLLSNYNKLVRPVVNVTDAVTVRLKLKLSQLIDVVSQIHLID